MDCFRKGGGVRYEEYARFHDVMADESAQTVVAGLFDHILPIVGGLEARLQRGAEALDIGCGKGRAVAALAERFPASRFHGYDLCADAIAAGDPAAAASAMHEHVMLVSDVALLRERPAE